MAITKMATMTKSIKKPAITIPHLQHSIYLPTFIVKDISILGKGKMIDFQKQEKDGKNSIECNTLLIICSNLTFTIRIERKEQTVS